MGYQKSISAPISKGGDANWQKKSTLKVDGSLYLSLAVVSILKKTNLLPALAVVRIAFSANSRISASRNTLSRLKPMLEKAYCTACVIT